MPPPPIPARKAEGNTEPPPIPAAKGEGQSPPIPLGTEEAQPEPQPQPSSTISQPKRRPAGAVATVMASKQEWLPSAARAEKGEDVEQQEEEEHSTNPYDLKAAAGSIVTASYPFHGDADLQQLSFTVGDMIKVKQKEDMWSWGVLERGGAEGWFPHNYVGSTFKPLPGIHEMAAKLKQRRERLEGTAASTSAGTSDAPDTTVPGSAEAPGTTLPGNTDGAGTAGMDGHGGANGGEPEDGGEANDAANSKGGKANDATNSKDGVAPGEDGDSNIDADRTNKAEQAKGASYAGDSEAGGTNKSTSPESFRKQSTEAEGESKPPSTSTAPSARLTSAAPSLPPFLKGGGHVSEVVTPAVVVTQRAPEATKDSEAVSTTPIEGVGYAGAPIQANTKCKCCIM